MEDCCLLLHVCVIPWKHSLSLEFTDKKESISSHVSVNNNILLSPALSSFIHEKALPRVLEKVDFYFFFWVSKLGLLQWGMGQYPSLSFYSCFFPSSKAHTTVWAFFFFVFYFPPQHPEDPNAKCFRSLTPHDKSIIGRYYSTLGLSTC